VIRAIPVHVEMDDIIAWHFDEKGCFYVKSAYRVHREALRRSQHHGRAGQLAAAKGMIASGNSCGRLTVCPR
jgi:hypothetical protein